METWQKLLVIGVSVGAWALVIAAVVTASDSTETDQVTTPARATARTAPSAIPTTSVRLELVSATCIRSSESFVTCEGTVRNVSGVRIENVVAVARFYDANTLPITSDDALIDYDPLLPGQDSPFTVIARTNPALEKWEIEFKEFAGAVIPHRTPTP